MIIFSASVMLASMLTGCLKKIDPLIETSNTATINFIAAGPKFLTGDVTVNPGDSIQFSYTVTNSQKMKYVSLVKNAINGDIFKDAIAPNADHYSYSAVKKTVADVVPGSYYYKVVTRDTLGVYLGDSKPIIVTVRPDFAYYTNKRIYVPDTTAKTNKTYFNFVTETAYSYSDIVAGKNSDQIDIGFFWDPTIASGTTPKGITLYNLNVSPIPAPISIYDISTFTKNLTVIKASSTLTWANVNAGSVIKAQCASLFATSSPNNNFSNVGISAGSIIYFKTPSGRCGAMLITYISPAASTAKGTYINFEVKLAN